MSESSGGIVVLIPAFNEENSVGKVIADLPKDMLREIIVINNNSNDNTREVAEKAGATVLDEVIPGYGRACLKGLAYLRENGKEPDIIVFLDADYSDHPEQLPELVKPLLHDGLDMVIGSRALGVREKGSMTFPQRFGNKLACFLMRILFDARFTDLGPFRAISYKSLLQLEMRDKNYGWTVEMQVKAARKKMKFTEVPMRYRRRIGVSKVSGTIKGTVMAGYKIIWTIIKYA